jgi:ribose transport system ATP-binding protein
VLVLAGIEKSYGEAPVLRGVSFEVRRGEVHALLGENGAGKSTLMRVVLGLEPHGAGTMTLGGTRYAPRSARNARARGVVMVPQERTLCAHLTVAENIVLGNEPAAFGVLRRAEPAALAARVLGLVTGDAARLSPSSRAGDLSVADQQLVEIARALAQAGVDEAGRSSARVLVLDEPTSSLGRDDADRLFLRVRALVETGLAVVLVTHFLGDVRAHADRYTVLRDGVVRGQGDPRETAPEQIVHEMLGRELEAAIGRAPGSGSGLASGSSGGEVGEAILEVKDLAGAERPRRASFVLHRGEILGLAGLVGSGRTELLRMILGLDRPRAGAIVRRPAGLGVGLLSEDRGGEGLMLGRSIADNVTLSSRGGAFVRPAAIRAEGARWIGELGVRARGPEQPAGELSGGNQQKVQIARLLREDYDVLLVDEPTRGIDVASKAQILALLRQLAARGKGIVLVSSQLDELVSTADRIAVLRGGELGPSRPSSEWSEETLLLEAAS